jgi:hypothetical protein
MVTQEAISKTLNRQKEAADMYFDRPGKDNTDQVLALAAGRAKALSINEVVVATTTGDTANRAVEIFDGPKITAVTYHSGFKEPFKNEMSADGRAKLQNKGVTVVAASHALSGVERAIANKHSGVYPVLIIADTLRLFGQGIKVAVEVSVMAADAGALSGNDIIAIGGSGRGADAALVLKPAHQNNFFDMRIREIICKPRNF